MATRIITDDEFIRLGEFGVEPGWRDRQGKILSSKCRKVLRRDGAVFEGRAEELLARQIGSLFGNEKMPEYLQEKCTVSLIETNIVSGLIAARLENGLLVIAGTPRLSKHWDRIFAAKGPRLERH